MAGNSTSIRVAASVVALAALAACSTDSPTTPKVVVTPSDPSLALDEGTETGTYLVRTGSAGAVSGMRTSVKTLGGRVAREIGDMNLLYVDGLSAQGAATLASRRGVTLAKDRVMQMVPAPSTDPGTLVVATGTPGVQGTDQSGAQFFAQYQWNMKVINADKTWVPSNGGAGETVCVLDSGIDPGHLDLNGTVDPSKMATAILTPVFPSDATPLDFNSHGTYVSALIRSNGIAMASVAPNATLCSVKVLRENGTGTFGDLIFGIFVASKLFGADVINMSLSGYVQETNPANGPLLALLQEVIDAARGNGTLVVAASGNDGFNMDDIRAALGFITVPAMMEGVISVGATGPFQQQNFDQMTAYSNFGGLRALDLVAPGGNGGLAGGQTEDFVLSACSRFAFAGACAAGNRYLFANGTSGASPHVAGAGAVVESNVGSMTTGKLEQCILNTTKFLYPGWKHGKGRLNVRGASLCTGK